MDYRIDQIRLLVTDFPACFRFYRDVLGLTPNSGDENDVYADFKTGATTIALYKRELMAADIGLEGKPASADAQDKVLINFAVDDVNYAVNQLKAKGVEIVYPPTNRPEWGGMRTVHFRDPAGNLIEIYDTLPAGES